MFSATRAWLLASILVLLSCGLFVAASAKAEEDELIIRDYLTNKPEILVEMTNELDKRQVAEQSVQQQKAISQNADGGCRLHLL